MGTQMAMGRFLIGCISYTLAASVVVAQNSCAGAEQQRREIPVFELPPIAPEEIESAWQQAVDDLLLMPVASEGWQQYAPYASQPPPDDAPEEILMAWWGGGHMFATHEFKPSDEVLGRLLEALPRYPHYLNEVMRLLPEDDEAARAVVAAVLAKERARTDTANHPNALDWVDRWLASGLPPDLEEARAEVRAPEKEMFNGAQRFPGERAVHSLLERDNEWVLKVLRMHAAGKDPIFKVWAWQHLHFDALHKKDDKAVAEARAALIALAADGAIPGNGRARCIDVLMNYEWPGRDEWFIGLFTDPTLNNLREGSMLFSPIQAAVEREPERLAPMVRALVGDPRDHVHNLAVRALARLDDVESLRAIVPWLEDFRWVRGVSYTRSFTKLIENVGKVEVPEAIPGLMVVVTTADSWDRAKAATALAEFYKDKRAIPALREGAVADGVHHDDRMTIWRALFTLEPVPIHEAYGALTAYASLTRDDEGTKLLEEAGDGPEVPADISLGILLAGEHALLSDDVIEYMVNRFNAFDPRYKRDFSFRFWQLVSPWPRGPMMDQLVTVWQRGKVSASALATIVGHREVYPKRIGPQLEALVAEGGYPAGVAALMLGDTARMETVLASDDTRARRALLAAARSAGVVLPLASVRPVLKAEDRDLVIAAKRYLASLDSPASRAMLFENEPEALLIVGKNSTFDPAVDANPAYEAGLRDRIRADESIDELYALVEIGYRSEPELRVIIEMRGAKARFYRPEIPDDPTTPRDLERALSEAETRAFLDFLKTQRVAELPPLEVEMTSNLPNYEFIHLTRQGGRRLPMTAPSLEAAASPYARLVAMMDVLR